MTVILWQKTKGPIYMTSSLVFVSFLVIGFSLFCYIKSKYRLKSNNRRFDNNYEYTRLNGTSFELGTNSESKLKAKDWLIWLYILVLNNNPTNGEVIDEEPEINSNERHHSSEYQRLLFVNS